MNLRAAISGFLLILCGAARSELEHGPAGPAFRPAASSPHSDAPGDSRQDDFDFVSNEPHRVRMLEGGADSLLSRIEMIDRATVSVDIAAYAFGQDLGGALILAALKRASARKVKVRILMDWYQAPGKSIIPPELAGDLEAAGIEVRYYNRASRLQPLKLTCRDHRKMLIVDGKRMIIGGRNWADSYWDIAYAGFAFRDRDVQVEGPVAEGALRSMREFFNSSRSASWKDAFPDYVARASAAKGAAGAPDAAAPNPKVLAELRTVAQAQRNSTKVHTVSGIRFVSDRPSPEQDDSRNVSDRLLEQIGRAEKNVRIETYNFLPDARTERLIGDLAGRKEVTILTNTYLTEGNVKVATFTRESLQRLARKGAKVYAVSGGPDPDQRVLPSYSPLVADVTWGTHAKTVVIDGKTSFVGSFNFDPRSKDLNAESGVIFLDAPDIAQELQEAIEYRQRATIRMDHRGRFVTGETEFKRSLPSWVERLKTNIVRPFKGQY